MPFGEVEVKLSRPRVPLYPYDKSKDAIVCHYSKQRPRTPSAKAPTRSLPGVRTAKSRPATATGSPSRKENKEDSPTGEQGEQDWNGRHHVTGSHQNARLYTLHRWYFDNVPGEVPVSARKHPKTFVRERPSTAPGGEEDKAQDSEVPIKRRDSKTSSKKRRPTDVLGNALEQQVRALYDATVHVEGLQVFADFYMWCIKKFKNLARCWRLMDQNFDMKVTKMEFLTSLRNYDFHGDARMIFNVLDRDCSGTLSYYHFDPSGAEDLAVLYQWIIDTFGSIDVAFLALDKNKDGNVTWEEFKGNLKAHGFILEGPMICLFEMLDLDRDQKIKLDELTFLDRWACPQWLKVEPDFTAAEHFREKLLDEYGGSSIRAWHSGLDKNQSMRVSWQEFEATCQHEHLPKPLRPHVWRAIDLNRSGWISLREFDKAAHELLLKFKTNCIDKYGSIKKVIQSLDANNSGWVSRKEFKQIESELGLSPDEGERLFQGLDLDGSKKITWAELKYLEKWDVTNENREDEFWQIMGECLAKKRKDNSQPCQSQE